MDEHDDDLDPEVLEDAAEEVEAFPDTGDDIDDTGDDSDADVDLDLDDDEAEL